MPDLRSTFPGARRSRPLVSVILPAHDYGRYLARAVAGVLAQTHRRLELIVVDDGSTDETSDVLDAFAADARVRRLVHRRRRGVSVARNTGLRHARGDLLAFLDADDAWLPDKLEHQVDLLSTRTDVGFTNCAGWFVDAADRRLAEFGATKSKRFAAELHLDLLYQCTVQNPMSTVLVRRRELEAAGPFRPGLEYAEDREVLCRLARRTAFAPVDVPLACIRRHDANSHGDVERNARGYFRWMLAARAELAPEHAPHWYRAAARFARHVDRSRHATPDAGRGSRLAHIA